MSVFYHCSIKTISRSSGRTATGAAAYRAGQSLRDFAGDLHDYTRKRGVLCSEIILPKDAPDWVSDRQSLWVEADTAEKRKNSTVARECNIALPVELNTEARLNVVRELAQYLVNTYGVAADVSLHLPDHESKNYHGHILYSTRKLGADGFGAKTRILDDRQTGPKEVQKMRKKWEDILNAELERGGIEARVDCRALEAQGIDRIPLVHEGPKDAPIYSSRRKRNEVIRAENERREKKRERPARDIERSALPVSAEAALPRLESFMDMQITTRPIEIPGFRLHVVAGRERRYSKESQADRRNDGGVSFIDRGDSVTVLAPKDDEVLLAALRVAEAKWGAVRVSGGDAEHRRRCVMLAVAHGIEIGGSLELQELVQEEQAKLRDHATKAEENRQAEAAEKPPLSRPDPPLRTAEAEPVAPIGGQHVKGGVTVEPPKAEEARAPCVVEEPTTSAAVAEPSMPRADRREVPAVETPPRVEDKPSTATLGIRPAVGQRVEFRVEETDKPPLLTGEIISIDGQETVTLRCGKDVFKIPSGKGYFTAAAPLSREETPEYVKEAARKYVGENGKVYHAADGGVYEGPILEVTPTYALQRTNGNTVTLHRLKDLEGFRVIKGESIAIEKDGNGMVQVYDLPVKLDLMAGLIRARELQKCHLSAMCHEVFGNCPDKNHSLRQRAVRIMYNLRDEPDEAFIDRQTAERMLGTVLDSRGKHNRHSRDDLGR